ncbi:MAG: ATPase domain-containing protein [Candidatus Bathyarchaeota archaeon]
MDLDEHNKAKGYIKNAATNYLKAGYKTASEYAKATQRLFDAYLFMNQAEKESDTEKRVKNSQVAENLLQLATVSFSKAQQPEKATQVKKILENVREEKKLAISFNEVLQAPAVASSTSSFSVPTSTNEVSIGLESFSHANVQATLITSDSFVRVGQSIIFSLEFINAGREPALLLRVDDFIPSGFFVVKKPVIYRMEDTSLNMKGKQLVPLKFVEVKLILQPLKKGNFHLNPKVHYLNEVGQEKTLLLKTIEIEVEEVLLEDRVSTGTQEVDSLLLGGIPNEFALVLTGSPSNERRYIIKNFLEKGIEKDEIVFYVSTEADKLENLLDNSNFFLFLCNPKPKTQITNLSIVFKLRSKTDITNLSIALAKAYRKISLSKNKRICIETLSDVLLDYGANATRKWISELITDLGSKGFTILAVLNPNMHPSDQAAAVIDLFDGEISITESDDPLDCKKSIQVKKLRNQEYIKNPICLTT